MKLILFHKTISICQNSIIKGFSYVELVKLVTDEYLRVYLSRPIRSISSIYCQSEHLVEEHILPMKACVQTNPVFVNTHSGIEKYSEKYFEG